MKELNDYQMQAMRTEQHANPKREKMLQNGLGLAGEAGEVADLIKKWAFHGHPMDDEKLKKELGDVLWYIAGVATAAGITLEEVATANIAKLLARYPDGFSSKASIERKGG
jgi:NTP pyrophosphatase (non-canonical NTP hydrolase)